MEKRHLFERELQQEAQLKKAQPEVTSALKGAGNLSNPNVSTKLG